MRFALEKWGFSRVRAFASGAKGRGFKSLRSDQINLKIPRESGVFLFPYMHLVERRKNAPLLGIIERDFDAFAGIAIEDL